MSLMCVITVQRATARAASTGSSMTLNEFAKS